MPRALHTAWKGCARGLSMSRLNSDYTRRGGDAAHHAGNAAQPRTPISADASKMDGSRTTPNLPAAPSCQMLNWPWRAFGSREEEPTITLNTPLASTHAVDPTSHVDRSRVEM